MSGKLQYSSENKSSENTISLATSDSITTKSVELDADRLMDDLFSDIDHILDSGSRLPSEPIHPDYIALKSVVVPPIIMPSPAHESAIVLKEKPTEAPKNNNNISLNTKIPSQNLNYKKDKKGWGNNIDKILFIIASMSLIGLVGWLIYNNKIQLPFLDQNNSVNVGNNIKISPEDSQFISYMLRSLEVIDAQPSTIKTTTTIIPNPTTTSVPIPPQNNTIQTQPQTVIERIYIPYPSNDVSENSSSSSSLTPTPVTTTAPTTTTTPAPTPTIENNTPSTTISVAPTSTSAPTVDNNPNLDFNGAPPTSVPTVDNNPNLDFNVPPPPLPGVTHTLVGLLEAGDSSAALFDINGSTQRIKVGEQIGSSGWALVSVASQQAMIRRNGEVRSIYVGQKF